MEEQNDIDNQSRSLKSVKLNNPHQKDSGNRLLCQYCGRTKLNSAKCIGRCVADNEY